jgi:hypothetical protein
MISVRARLMPICCMLLAAGAAPAQQHDPLRTLPGNYRVAFENDVVRVVHVLYRPHEKLPVHDHPMTPTIYVYLADSGPVQFSHVEEHAFSLQRPAVKAGTFRVSPGRIEVHSVENLGDSPSEFLRVELKKIPIGFRSGDFRDRQPFSLKSDSLTWELRIQHWFGIERIVAAGSKPVDITDLNKPSLLISIARCLLRRTGPSDSLAAGDIRWFTAGQHFGVERSAGGPPAHLLRVVFQ